MDVNHHDKPDLILTAEQIEAAKTEADRRSEAEQSARLNDLAARVARIEAHLWPAPPDPTKPDDPIVWSVADDHGMWATPALYDGVVIAPTDSGRIIAADQQTGEVLWEKKLPGPTWSSPVVVDDVWIQGDCNGVLHGYDVADPRTEPTELWSVQLEGCVESTPAVFQGRIFVGARGGAFYGIGDPE